MSVTRTLVTTSLRAAFDTAARAYSADASNDTKKTAATDAYALAYPAAAALFVVDGAGELIDDPDNITPDGTLMDFCIRNTDGVEVLVFRGSDYDVKAIWDATATAELDVDDFYGGTA